MTNVENRQTENIGGAASDWKHYPYAIGDDPELAFPGAEGDQGAESNTYYVAGRLTGRSSGHRWAFLVIFTFNDIWHRLRADFRTMALFDLETGDYGTSTELDFPRLFRRRRDHRLSIARGSLDVSFRGERGESFWHTRRDGDGSLVPFAYDLGAIGVDGAGRTMKLELALETRKPPLPVGGKQYGGVKTCMGQYGTHSYFQSDVRFSGKILWGEKEEEVDGDCGWIDRQWSPRYLGVHTGLRNTRYRHEWREIHLEGGIEMSVWMHFDRRRANRVIPFSGVTAAGPSGEIDSTTDFTVERMSFVRDPGVVVPRYPLPGAKYFTDRYRLRVPVWDLDVFSEPLVAAPAHALPIEYWSGPTRIRGTLDGKPVTGFGFHERTLALSRDFELVDVLRSTLRHLRSDALADRVWEIDAFLGHGDNEGAVRYLDRRIRPEIASLPDASRAAVATLVDDLRDALVRWWVRP